MNAVRDSEDLRVTDKILAICLGLFQRYRPADDGGRRGEVRDCGVETTDGWRPAVQTARDALRNRHQDPEHPEIIEVQEVDDWHRGELMGRKLVAVGLCQKKLCAITGLSHVGVIRAMERLEKKGWVRVVVDVVGGPRVLMPGSDERLAIRSGGKPPSRVLFVPGGAMNAHVGVGTRNLWRVIDARDRLGLSNVQFLMMLTLALRGYDPFHSEGTWARDAAVKRRTIRKHVAALSAMGVLRREKHKTRSVWKWDLRAPEHERERAKQREIRELRRRVVDRPGVG